MTAILFLMLARTQLDASALVQPNLENMSFAVKVVSGNQDALKKINRDFGTSYKFSSAHVWFKEPLMLRVESIYEGSKVVMTEDGTTTVYSVPSAHLRRSRDTTHSPGGRQTLLDFGLLSESFLAHLFEAKFVSQDPAAHLATFDLTFQASPDYQDSSRQRIQVDTDRRYIVRREWYGQDQKLKATFDYKDPRLVNGHWIPTDVTVTNGLGELAGETRAEDIQINQGLDSKLFSVK